MKNKKMKYLKVEDLEELRIFINKEVNRLKDKFFGCTDLYKQFEILSRINKLNVLFDLLTKEIYY